MNAATPMIRLSRRIYSALLWLYPVSLRRQFEDEMIEVFTDQLRDACRQDGVCGGLSVWRCIGGELLRTAVSSHLQIVGISVVSGITAFALLSTFFWVMSR